MLAPRRSVRWPGDLRHKQRSAEGCWLPPLTRFTVLPCAGPSHRTDRRGQISVPAGHPLRESHPLRRLGAVSVAAEPGGTHQSLYRRFRSQTFGELRGQDHVVAALRNAVKHGTTAHAYLFSGPRGTGKTSAARILAKALNCTDPTPDGDCCAKCESCRSIANGSSLDVLELDAASNNGVEAMRDLISRVGIGSPGRTKVYIVDEVHMLSHGASNALLKTLEEPPDHVKFVLATTDPQKMLPTIRSRTQHHEFRLIAPEVLSGLIDDVAAEAGIELESDALDAVVRRGHGSARDTLSMLELVAAAGYVPDESATAHELIAAVAAQDPAQVLAAVARGVQAGRDPRRLGVEMVEALRNCFLSLIAPDLLELGPHEREAVTTLARQLGPAGATRALEVIGECLVEMREALDTRVTLEVAMVRLARPRLDTSPGALAERLERLEAAMAAGGPTIASDDVSTGMPPTTAPTSTSPKAAAPSTKPKTAPEPGEPAHHSGGEPGQFGPAQARSQLQQRGEGATRVTRPARKAPSGPPQRATNNAPASPSAPAPPLAFSPAGAERGTRTPPPAASGPSADTASHQARPDPQGEPPSTRPVPELSPSDTASRAMAPRLDELEAAWPKVLEMLTPGVRSRFRGGSFIPEEGPDVVFGFDNQATLDRCKQEREVVQQALSRHFGRSVPLRLVVGGGPKKADGDPGYGEDTGHEEDGDQNPPPIASSTPNALGASRAGQNNRSSFRPRRAAPTRRSSAPPPPQGRPISPAPETRPGVPESASWAKVPPEPGAPMEPRSVRLTEQPSARPSSNPTPLSNRPGQQRHQPQRRPQQDHPVPLKPSKATAHSEGEDEDIRLEELLDAPPAVASDAKQLLLDAFPGSEEIQS